MRILFVTPYVPSRIRVRPFNLIKSLSSSHEISLVSLLCDEYERELVQEVADYCVSVDLVPLSKARSYANCLAALPTRVPLRVAYYRSPELVRCVRRVIREQSIEVAHGELIKITPAMRVVLRQESIPALYDSVDCISWYLQQEARSERNLLKKAFVSSELIKMRRYEPRALGLFDQAVITSTHDRDCLIALGEQSQHVKVVPNGVDIEYFAAPTPATSRENDTLVFCAKLDYYPNAQAIVRFCREILPLIWQKRPEVRLTIVGNNPPPAVRDLGADSRISVTGYVPDIRPYLEKASVALAPLRVAAGMQNKVLEALAMGAPVVATPAACRSLNVEHGTHLLMAEEGEFAHAVVSLLEDAGLAESLGRAGRAYVEEYHSWTTAANILSDFYRTMAVKHGALVINS
jgi:sugar transferase (PEP-CTERM/EpsH1 system associated)